MSRHGLFRNCPDPLDLLFEQWARTRREVIGLAEPQLSRHIVGPKVSVAGKTPGSSTGTESQTFPEVYEGEALIVNLAWQRMTPDERDVVDKRYAFKYSGERAARALGISKREFWYRLSEAKKFLSGYLARETDSGA